MAKVGIITYHHVVNYGAAMQAWALQSFLQAQGHEVFLVDYRPSHLTTGGCFWLPTSKWRMQANLVIGYMKLLHFRGLIKGDQAKTRKFEDFHQKHFKLSQRRYASFQELKRNPPQADAIICGSDQIWNASRQYGIDPAYFLDWVPAGVKRVAYAPSFGRPVIDPLWQSQTTQAVNAVQVLSVREASGVTLIREMTGRVAAWVPDPTLLWAGHSDAYHETEAPDKREPYLFSYTLRSRELVQSVENCLCKHLACDLISPLTLQSEGREALSPLEWLGHIQHAQFVVTNSYHGTLFSVIFKKPFIFVGLQGEKQSFNERAKSLLERIGLQDRMVFSFDETHVRKLARLSVNWDHAASLICEWRNEAIHYLSEALRA